MMPRPATLWTTAVSQKTRSRDRDSDVTLKFPSSLMLTFRPTLMLAKRLHLDLPAADVPADNPFTDWCAHGFTAERHRYVILTNTRSLFSVVTHGAGITSEGAFIRRALDALRETLRDSGREFAWERHIAPAMMEVRFARLADRRVMGSMNDLIYMAKVHLEGRDVSPMELSARMNETPLSLLWKRGTAGSPDRAFDELTRSSGAE